MIWCLPNSPLIVRRTEYGCRRDTKCAYLLSLSTTIIGSNPQDFSSPSMKSIEISSQFLSGISNGWRTLARCTASVLFLWQVSHFYISFHICLHTMQKQLLCHQLYVRKYPEWPPRIESWKVCRREGIKDEVRESTNLPWYSNFPCFNWYFGLPSRSSLRIEIIFWSSSSCSTSLCTKATSNRIGAVKVNCSTFGFSLERASAALFWRLAGIIFQNHSPTI